MGFLVFGGFAEYRLGVRKAAFAFVVCHVFAVVGLPGVQGGGVSAGVPFGTPLAKAGAADSVLDRGPLDSFLDRLGSRLEPYYGFWSLHAFKAKFQPRFKPLVLVFPDEAALPRIGMALSRTYLPDAGLRDLVTLAHAGR